MTQPRDSQDTPRPAGWLSALLFFVAVGLVVAAVILLYPDSPGEATAETTTTSTTTTTSPAVDVTLPEETFGEEPIADAAEVILPSVVHIRTATGVGAGVMYSEGLVMTAAHVVEGEESVGVRFTDGDQVNGTVLGTAPDVDIAVIEVERSDLPSATFALEKPRVGQMAVAVGSPWGLESTVTAGIVSAVDQTNCFVGSACSSMLQTDAAINPGNSGGALVDRNGHVIGINVAIFTSSGANDGVGFAVPASIAVTYADAIVSGEPIETAFLGVGGGDVTEEGQAGALITLVSEDSAAEAAGIEVDDVVIGLAGVPILGIADLQAQVRAHQPGAAVDVLILRDGEEIVLEATLGVRAEDVG